MKLPNLERYNQVILAIIGTGTLVMVMVGLSIGTIEIIGNVLRHTDALPVAVVDEDGSGDTKRDLAQYDFCQPISVPRSPYQLIRVSSDKFVVRNIAVAKPKISKGFSSSDEYGSSQFETCGYNRRGNPSAVVNVLVRNANNGKMHLALDENAVIYTLEFPTERIGDVSDSADFPPVGMLFWEMAYTDSSGDGVIDEDDDVGAYLSDADGRNLQRITPIPSRVLERTYDKKNNMLLLRILRDTNGDKKIDDEDSVSLVESSLTTRTMIREILDKKTLSELMLNAEPKQATNAKMVQ